MSNKSGNTAVEHMTKQRKNKKLPNTKVYGSIGGVVEMHDLGDYEVENKQLKTHIIDLIEENGKLNTRVDNAKNALTELLIKIEKIERKMKTYGLD